MIFSAKVLSASSYIKKICNLTIDCGLILDSGLGMIVDNIQNKVVIPYDDIPFFPTSAVSGHAGSLVIGTFEGKRVCAMQGRFHYYEGYSLREVCFPIFVMHKLGINKLIVTNTAGAINTEFKPGNLMLISDHLNLIGDNPLKGLGELGWGPMFPNMVDAYSQNWRSSVKDLALDMQLDTVQGVYAALMGPTYVTPAEINYLRSIGADAVGMSTVSEVIVARYCGIDVLGISCITSMTADLQEHRANAEVKETTTADAPALSAYISRIVKEV